MLIYILPYTAGLAKICKQLFTKKNYIEPDMVAHALNPSTDEVEAGRSREFQSSLVYKEPQDRQQQTEKPCLEKRKTYKKKKTPYIILILQNGLKPTYYSLS